MKTILFEKRTVQPSKIVCIGRNYVGHIRELKNEMPDSMVVFNKPNSAISEAFCYFGEDCRFECEISFLIEGGAFAGVAAGFDLTKADLQARLKSKGLPWERAKAFDGSAVFSEFLRLDAPIETLALALDHNGRRVQTGSVPLMIYRPDVILQELQTFMSLEDGDIIMTGTPAGTGPYAEGDTFVAKILSEDRLLVEANWVVEACPHGSASGSASNSIP